MPNTNLQLETFHGNTQRVTFVLHEFGVLTAWQVNAASAIYFEYTFQDGVESSPVALQRDTPGADWAAGAVVVEFAPTNVTATVGSYSFAVTVLIDGKVITAVTGQLEVKDRPGYPLPNVVDARCASAVTAMVGELNP